MWRSGIWVNTIKEYFLSQFNLSGNLTVDFARHSVHRENEGFEDWAVHLIETGIDTEYRRANSTAARLDRRRYVHDDVWRWGRRR